MDLYISSLLLGAAGLGVMALSGLGSRGHAGAAGHAGHGAHVGGHAHVGHAARSLGQVQAAAGGIRGAAVKTVWSLTSPRLLFSFLLGFGTVGVVVRPLVGGLILPLAAIAGGVALERLLVAPIWNFAMRFASTPATTLESAIADEATAVTAFDANGQGIVSLEVDGQIVQVLATLQPDAKLLAGPRIRAGQRLRIEEVDAERHRCTVSPI